MLSCSSHVFFSDKAEILHSLSSLLDETRCQFPRLYFMSDEELVEVLAASRDVQQLLPVARKCFPGIMDIVFEVPTAVDDSSTNGSSGTSFALNGMLCVCVR